MADRVRFTGFVPSPHPYLAEADAFVLATDFEGFGNVIVEAMAHGLPVVASDVPHGPRYLLDGGRFGCLVKPGMVEPLTDALVQALAVGRSDPERARAVVERAREFSLDRVAERFSEQLQRHVGIGPAET